VKTLTLLLALPFMLAAGVAVHAGMARGIKAILWSASPLTGREAEAHSYERRVYHTAEPAMMQIVLLALLAGGLGWLGLARPSGLWWAAGSAVLIAAVVLDIGRWQRLSVSANQLCFQRGVAGTVHRVPIEDIVEVSVHEFPTRGFTLRHGTRNRLARLQLEVADRRVVALPKTDAERGLDDIEAVANHLRIRIGQRDERTARSRGEAVESDHEDTVPTESAAGLAQSQRELQASLMRLREAAAERAAVAAGARRSPPAPVVAQSTVARRGPRPTR
jgi:hypothetical protein